MLKKILILLVSLISVFSLWSVYASYSNFKFEEIRYVEARFAETFKVPNHLMLADDELVYPVLLATANEMEANLFRTHVIYQDDEIMIKKYILLANQTQLWEYVKLNEGDVLSVEDTQSNDQFLSTSKIEDQQQVGQISLFGNNPANLDILPLQKSYESLPVRGSYHVELAENVTLEDFLSRLAENLTQSFEDGGIELDEPFLNHDFLEYDFIYGRETYSNIYLLFIVFVVLISSFAFAYGLIAKTKKISIFKMSGLSNLNIVYRMLGKPLIFVFATTISSTIAIASIIAYYYKDFSFFKLALQNQLILYGVIFTSLIFSYMMILLIPIYQGIKSKTYQKPIFLLNTLLKIVISVIILLMAFSEWHHFQELRGRERSFESWEHHHDYGMFYPLAVGNDQTWEAGYQTSATMRQELYPILNSQGAIFINARSYSVEALLYNEVDWRYITVNPNYLQAIPLYDYNDEVIFFDESDDRYLVLVPEQYQEQEESIRAFFREDCQWLLESETNEAVYGIVIAEHLQNDEVTIIWTKQNQPILSFNPEVFPHDGNIIHDPIIRVITENNSLSVEREMILGDGATDSLMVKLINNDVQVTYETLIPILEDLELEYNLKSFLSINELIQLELAEMRTERIVTTTILIALTAIALFFVIQNIIISFDIHQKEYTLKRLFGYGYLRTYQSYLYYLFTVWAIQLLAVNMVWEQFIESVFVSINPLVIVTFLGMELILFITMSLKLEKKQKTIILKDGE